MSEPSDSYTRHAAHFERVYDLDDPSPYFATLRRADYRMPAALAAALKAIHGPLSAARGTGETLRVLDFACGYGAIGALLRHDVSISALYAHYAARQWQPADGRRYWEDDIAFFAARRVETAAFEIGGIDIAGNALAYAAALGFVDRAYPENLVDDAPSAGWRASFKACTWWSRAAPWACCCRTRSRACSIVPAASGRPGFSTALVPT